MIALEYLRESLTSLDWEADILDDCIDHNKSELSDNFDQLRHLIDQTE